MKIIATHEQADFDAVASLLAAKYLYPDHTPILPKRVNRNITAFLNDFREDFSFYSYAKIKEETISAVLIVDTQSLSNTSRVTAETEISVIDHHQPKLNLPQTWKCQFERTGACTTILVEKIQERGLFPSAIHSVMLLMGIYEDTGNMTYGSTTARDLKAAAWLLEQGADLNVLNRYLNQPLSEPQSLLADRLLENSETLDIMGQQIVISQADARDINDEFSTVAHYLRDMLSPDAIFVLLATKAGVRLIARATNDRLDVGKIMKQFNGGGHARAAAGLCTTAKELDPLDQVGEIRKKLLEMLPLFITPPIMVEEIMSTRPLVIDSDMKLNEVAELVQRYGYEGYPIVDRSQNLIGLLNRRSVERAQVFKLDPSIESIMNAGNFSVKPGDSVEYLKELMSLSGWGQIPVIERNSSEIIGIVTRTDLIKTLTGRSSIPGNRNYAQLLQRTLPTDALTLIKIVAETAYNCHYPVYIVGGFVRDLILEKPVMDFDIVVEGDAVHLARMLVNLYGGKVKIHAKFGTAKWMIEDIHDKITRKPEAQSAAVRNGSLPNSLDLISARTEFYDYPTAMPKVERSSIKLDLHRRDFTINTLALRLDGDHFGDLLDFWGGFLDLQQKLIRVLHSLSFTDDPTRMLRAIRFENRFNFAIEKNTRMQLMESRMLLKRVSGRRIINELELFFREENPAICLSELEDTGLLAQIHPAMRWHTQQTKALQMLTEAEIPDYWLEALPELPQFLQVSGKFLIWLGDHPVDVINEIGKRLQLSQASLKMLKSFSELRQKMPEIIQSWPSEQTFFLENQSLEAIYCYDCLAEDDRVHHSVQKFLTSWRYLKPFTTGSDLRKQPYPAGNWISGVLKRLRKGWIDEEISSREEEQKTLDYILPIFTKGLVPKGKNPIAD